MSEQTVETLLPKKFCWIAFSWVVGMPFVSVALLVAYIYYNGVHWGDIFNFVLMYALVGLSITAGYHRYFSHKAYKSKPALEWFYLLFAAASMQRSVIDWSSNHRFHHQYVDRDEDPYNINKGFFWAHIGWIFWDELTPRPYANVSDLKRNPRAMLQHKYYYQIAIFVGFVVPMIIGAFFGRPWGGFIWGGWLRCALMYQATYAINSWAHYFGRRPYSTKNTARDSLALALVSMGEGYHNYHHTFPSDYRNGIAWHHWDPSKWLIRALSYMGLASDLRVAAPELIERAKASVRMETEDSMTEALVQEGTLSLSEASVS